jgi:hypothetical protein
MKHIFLVHTDNGYIGSYIMGRIPAISYAPKKEFISFVKGLREDFPKMKPIFVVNEQIKRRIEQQIKWDKARENNASKGRE